MLSTYSSSPSSLCSIAGGPPSASLISGKAGTANGTSGPDFTSFCDAYDKNTCDLKKRREVIYLL